MGLLRAGAGALGGALADQWREFFYCDSLTADILAVKGQKRTSRRSSNVRAEDNIITNGSGIAVADGQCMIIVQQGEVIEVCAEPGEFTFDNSTEPSVFVGGFGEGLKQTFRTIGRRFTFGGDTGRDQRVYYFNTKEILNNRFGTPSPVQFRVVEPRANLDTEVSIRCNGVYSYRISDPILFYRHISGNMAEVYERAEIDEQLKTEFIDALQPALGELSNLALRPYQIPQHVRELKDVMNKELSASWGELRGLTVVKIAMNPITLTPEDQKRIQVFQDRVALSNPGLAAGAIVEAQAEAMKSAASNPNGPMGGFVGMGFAGQMGGMNSANLFNIANQQQGPQPPQGPQPVPPAGSPAGGWTCACGAVNTAKFCSECGKPRPEEKAGWTCGCGAVNKGRFCTECGKPKPAGEPLYRCDKCGWEPEDPHHPPRFCPECGDPFGDGDKV